MGFVAGKEESKESHVVVGRGQKITNVVVKRRKTAPYPTTPWSTDVSIDRVFRASNGPVRGQAASRCIWAKKLSREVLPPM